MKNKKIIYIIICLTIICFENYSYGQATSAGFNNSPQGVGDYLGWTSGTNRSLEIMNQDAFPINLSTNDVSGTIKERMRITYGNGWNGAAVPNVTKVNISYGPGSPISNSISILNLGENIPTGGGGRNWMDVGTLGCVSTDK